MIKHITTINEYDETIKTGTVLVDFYANWCGPCQMLASVLEEIDDKQLGGDVTIVKVNVDDLMDIAARYGIQSIPTLILFKDGKIVNSSLGYLNKSQVLKFLGK